MGTQETLWDHWKYHTGVGIGVLFFLMGFADSLELIKVIQEQGKSWISADHGPEMPGRAGNLENCPPLDPGISAPGRRPGIWGESWGMISALIKDMQMRSYWRAAAKPSTEFPALHSHKNLGAPRLFRIGPDEFLGSFSQFFSPGSVTPIPGSSRAHLCSPGSSRNRTWFRQGKAPGLDREKL